MAIKALPGGDYGGEAYQIRAPPSKTGAGISDVLDNRRQIRDMGCRGGCVTCDARAYRRPDSSLRVQGRRCHLRGLPLGKTETP
jgi:hypothetical protein